MGDTANLNRTYFDNEAASYDQKHGEALDQLIEEMRAKLDFIGVNWVGEDEDEDGDGDAPERRVKILDYACGTGLVSRALAPYVTQCVGIDISEGMVAAYNARADNQGLTAEEMRAYQGNLLDPSDPNPAALSPETNPQLADFDLAAVGLGFHHFDDPELAVRRLAGRLRRGGVLFVLDFMPHEHVPPAEGRDGQGVHGSAGAARTVRHAGFSEERVRELFEKGGAGDEFRFGVLARVVMKGAAGGTRSVFMARGTKE